MSNLHKVIEDYSGWSGPQYVLYDLFGNNLWVAELSMNLTIKMLFIYSFLRGKVFVWV